MAQEEAPKVLIDACATPALVEHLLHQRGIEAVRSDKRLAPNASDAQVVALARQERRIIVTVNAEDFRKLASGAPDHPGLIILPSVVKAKQIELATSVIDRILDDIKKGRRPEGHVYEIDAKGTIRRYKLPA